MSKLVILCLGRGSLVNGCPEASLELVDSNHCTIIKRPCHLPKAPELLQRYEHWQVLYRDYYKLQGGYFRNALEEDDDDPDEISEAGITNFSECSVEDVIAVGQELIDCFNQWLNTPEFSRIEKEFRSHLGSFCANFLLVVETDNEQLRQLPWERWAFIEDYREAGVAVGSLSRERVPRLTTSKLPKKVNILAVFGDGDDCNTNPDREEIQKLDKVDVQFLDEPGKECLSDRLWESKCGIFFYAGHSSSTREEGWIKLNKDENLTVEELSNALSKAIERNLKLAIFNSCDGLKLASELASLRIPAVIVMQQPVPDAIAQRFLKYFLQAFSHGNSLDSSVRKAAERLKVLEKDFPCASWLPKLIWNRAEPLPLWQENNVSLPSITPSRCELKQVFIASLIVTGLVMGARWLGKLEPLEMLAYDELLSHRPAEAIDPHLAVIEINDKDVENYEFPIKDEAILADALKIIQQGKPRAIGLDIHRFKPRGKGREQFIEGFRKNNNFLTVCAFGENGKEGIPAPPEFLKAPLKAQLGFSDLEIEQQLGNWGDMVRRQRLSYDHDFALSSPCPTPYSFSFLLAEEFLYREGKPLTTTDEGEWKSEQVVFKRLPTRFGGYQILEEESNNQILLNYRSKSEIAIKFSLDDVLSGRVDPNLFKDKVILIGYTAAIADDYFDTPYGKMPGVWIHAQMVSNIISAVLQERPLIWVLPQSDELQWGDVLWIWSCCLAVGLLMWRFSRPIHLIIVCGSATFILYKVSFILLKYGGWMPLVPSVIAIIFTGIIVIYLQYSQQEQRQPLLA